MKPLRFGPKLELNDAWVAREDIDIEEILRDRSDSIDNRKYHKNSFLVTINTWTTKTHYAIDCSVRTN
jgi:hypothetical protein